MAHKEPTVSWQVLLDDAHWDRDASAPAPPPDPNEPRPRLSGRRWLILAALVVIVGATTAAFLLWQKAQRSLTLLEDEIAKVVSLEAAAQAEGNRRLVWGLLDSAAGDEWRERVSGELLADRSALPVLTVESVELAEGMALVQLSSVDPDLPAPSRQVRFYRDAPGGWLRTAPVASFWGADGEWAGEHFIFRYRQRDRDAVLAAAPQVESIYLALRRSLGLPQLPGHKTVIVQPDDRPIVFDLPSGELRQPSPHLIDLPATVTHQDALFRSLVFYLINDLVRESFDLYGYGRAWMWSNLTESALRNWLQLESGAVQMESELLFPWLFGRQAGPDGSLPAGVAEECQLMQTLGVRVLLLACSADIQPALPNSLSALTIARLVTTYDFDFNRDAHAGNSPSGPTWRIESRQEIVAATTILLYATETYGVDRFPALLEALGDHRGLYEAIPAAYDIPPEAFEVGWRVWLTRRFGVGE